DPRTQPHHRHRQRSANTPGETAETYAPLAPPDRGKTIAKPPDLRHIAPTSCRNCQRAPTHPATPQYQTAAESPVLSTAAQPSPPQHLHRRLHLRLHPLDRFTRLSI